MLYMLIGTFLIAGSMGSLELDRIGWEQFLLQVLLGLIISIYGFKRDKANMDSEEQEDVIYHIPVIKNCGEYCRNPYYK